ncbi:MAG: chromate transporter [Clostridia bacterium]|nr:chromate transporter [Clostridia bacterium]
MNIFLELFFTFMRIGLFTFGGGYAMISLIEDICVEKKKWITHEEMMDVAVIAESTPGPIAVNAATFVGYRKGGFFGALCSTLGVAIPSFVIIYVISLFFENFLEVSLVSNAFKGIRIAVSLLILRAGYGMVKKMKKKPFTITVAVLSFIAVSVISFTGIRFSTVLLMLFSAVAGISMVFIKEKGEKI